MPDIDVSEVLESSDVAGEGFSVVRQQSDTNNFGENVVTTETIEDLYGSVTPTGDNSMVRQDAFEQGNKTIRVVTPFRLRGPSKAGTVQYLSDLVLWNGDYYIVRTTDDYTSYGVGMVEADCELFQYVPSPPAE